MEVAIRSEIERFLVSRDIGDMKSAIVISLVGVEELLCSVSITVSGVVPPDG